MSSSTQKPTGSIEQLPDVLNFGKNSRKMLGSNVMPLLNKALQQTMLQLPSNPTYHIAQFLRENNPSRGAQPVEVSLPAIFVSSKDDQALASGALRFDEFESQLSTSTANRKKKSLEQLSASMNNTMQSSVTMINNTNGRSPNNASLTTSSSAASTRKLNETTDTVLNLTAGAPLSPISVTSLTQQQQQQRKSDDVASSNLKEIQSKNQENENENTDEEPIVKKPKPQVRFNEMPIMVEAQEERKKFIKKRSETEQSSNDDDGDEGNDETKNDDINDDVSVPSSSSSTSSDKDDEEDAEYEFIKNFLLEQQQDRFERDESKEMTLKLSGREKDGQGAKIYQNGRLPVWAVELPVMDGLETIFSRVNELVYDYEIDQEPLQQHDMNNKHHCFFSKEREKREKSHHQNNNNKNSSSKPLPQALGKKTSSCSNTSSSVASNNNNSSTRKRIKIHFVICGTVDIQCYIGGICMRGVLGQDVCKILQTQTQENNNNDNTIAEKFESQCIKALQMGVKLRPNLLQEKYRQVVSIETAIKNSFSQFQQHEQDRYEHFLHHNNTTSSNESSLSSSSLLRIKSESCEVHRLSEFHDASVSEQYVEKLHKIAELCASERANGICSVIAVCSTYKQSFVRNTCELFSAYFLQRSRALHLDRVGFAIANDENIRKLLAQTPLNLHEQALKRRKKRDEIRRKLSADQERYLRVNGLEEDPEIKKLLQEAADRRKERREREDMVAIEMTNKCIRTAATRAQMCFKMHVAWQSLMEGRTAAIISKDDATDQDLEKYRIADPPLLRVITEHLRESLGTETVASLEHTPRSKPAIVQKRKILLVRHARLAKHKKLEDLDVSSEEEEWFEVEKERSSESNLEAARAVVSAPCRPWDDVATLCRWCGEDGILNKNCEMAGEFSGRCSLQTRLLKDFERLAFLLFYDVYCYMLWRDRTAKNRRVHQKDSDGQGEDGGGDPGALTKAMSVSAFLSHSHLSQQSIDGSCYRHQGPGRTPTLSTKLAMPSSLTSSLSSSSANFESTVASSSMSFSSFLECWCSKALSMLNVSSWSVSTALGLYYQKPFLSLNQNQQQHSYPVVLPMSFTEIVSSGSNAKELSKKTATAIAESTNLPSSSSKKKQQLTSFGSANNNANKRNQQQQQQRSSSASAAGFSTPSNNRNKNSKNSKEDEKKTAIGGSTALVVAKKTSDDHRKNTATSSPSSLLSSKRLPESPWMRRRQQQQQSETETPPSDEKEEQAEIENESSPNKRRPASTPTFTRGLQTPTSLAPVNDHLFKKGGASKTNNATNKKKSNNDSSKNTNGADENLLQQQLTASTSLDDPGNNINTTSDNIFQNRAPLSEGERSSEFGLLEAVGEENDNNNNQQNFGGGVGGGAADGDHNNEHQQNTRAIRLDPKLTAVEQPLPELPGSFYFVSEAMPLKAIFDTSKSIFAESNWLVQQQQKNNNNSNAQQQNSPSASAKLQAVKGVCWVSTVPDPVLYVEEDEVISLSARPAHAQFELNELLPPTAFLGYTQNHPAAVVATTTSSSSKSMTMNKSRQNQSGSDIGGGVASRGGSTILAGGGGAASSVLSGSTLAPPGVADNQTQVQHTNQHSSKSSTTTTTASGIKNKKRNTSSVSGEFISHNANQQQRKQSSSTFFPSSDQNNKMQQLFFDPFSQEFWKNQEQTFQEHVKRQLSKWKGALYLFGCQNYNEIMLLMAASASSSNSSRKNNNNSSNLVPGNKPSQGRCTFWFGPQAGSLFSTFFNTTTNTSLKKLKLQYRNALQHPASIPKINAIKKKFRVAPENLQYERAVGTSHSHHRHSIDDVNNNSSEFTAQLREQQKRDSQDQSGGSALAKDYSSRPMSATHSSIGSWSDVVKLNNAGKQRKKKKKRDSAVHQKRKNIDEQKQGDDDEEAEDDEEEEEEEDEHEPEKIEPEGGDNSASATKQLMLPSVRTADSVENLVRNKLIAYKCGHHNNPSKGDPEPFQYLRFPICDGFGKVFLDRLDDFRKAIEEIHPNVAVVFTMASPSSIFTSLIAMMTRMMMMKTANNADQNSFLLPTTTTSSSSTSKNSKQIEHLKSLAELDASFLSNEVHIIFQMMKSSPELYSSLIEVLILLRRMNLVQSVVSVIDTHRQFAENASRAPLPNLPSNVEKLPGTQTNNADEFNELAHVHRKRLVAWYAAQSAQKIERLVVLVMMHRFLKSSSSSSSFSFYEFCSADNNGILGKIMNDHLMNRIDPWQLPSTCKRNTSTAAPEEEAGNNNDREKSSSTSTSIFSPTSLERTMRDSTMIPSVSPLHPLSHATHKNKRWAKEQWLERAA